MKVGFTFVIRLALEAFAPAQAFYKSLLPLFTGLLMLFIAQPTIASSSPHEQIANRHSSIVNRKSSIVNPIVIPFKLVGQSMFVQATINDQTGTFLFDTGASDLILNSAYFTGLDEQSEVVGLYGEVISVKHFLAHQVVLSGTSVAKDIALVLDLSAMEKVKKMPTAGILGYSVLQGL
ncbi:MAG: aspartyl protease family protein [Saprospiraceae bacterium]|nr:aspartyl protease family protein [Saprospiraceae bacterium]